MGAVVATAHGDEHWIRCFCCGCCWWWRGTQDFEKKKELCVNAVFEHLGLASVPGSRRRRLFLLRRHVPSSVFDSMALNCDLFLIRSTFLHGDRVIERRGRVGGPQTYTLARVSRRRQAAGREGAGGAEGEKGERRTDGTASSCVAGRQGESRGDGKQIKEARIVRRAYTEL